MRLREFQVQMFRNILDTTPIEVEGDVTCLVGKNESGKTALLQALQRINPAQPAEFDANDQYPRWRFTDDRKKDLIEKTQPIRAVFELEAADLKAISDLVGEKVVEQEALTVSVGYDNTRTLDLKLDESQALQNLLAANKTSDAAKKLLAKDAKVSDIPAAVEAARKQAAEAEDAEKEALESAVGELERLDEAATAIVGESDLWHAVAKIVTGRLPKFFYFSEYSILPGRVELAEIASEEGAPPGSDDLQTARALMNLAGADVARLGEEEYELRKAELEAVSNKLTNEVFEYWKQNTELQVTIDIDKVAEDRPGGERIVRRDLDVRVLDRRHGYSNNFGQRSSGFQWFFSFLAAFSEFEDYGSGVVVLLDEPALSLHGRAQGDFLRFINERLAPNHQVVYTTHSLFMIEPDRLERARIVEDKGPDEGAKVSAEVLATDPDSLFPLQAALGYDIAQSLFIGPDNLLVEGTSDYTYLVVLSDHLRSLKRTPLDERWRILPTGGAQNIPAFVALLGQHLEVSVLIDASTKGAQRITDLGQRGLLSPERIVTVGEITNEKNADIEDVFVIDDYLKLYNGGMSESITEAELPEGDRIVKRLEDHKGAFEHGDPADYLLRNRDTLLPDLGEETLDRFEALFKRINETLD